MKKSILQKGTKRILVLAILFAICGSLFSPVHAEEDNRVIRVGFFAFDGYHNISETGERSGYGYEFIQKVLRYNDYTAEYIGYDSNWSEMQKMLEDGTIDVLTSAQKTPEREEKFDFSEPIGTSAAILTVKAGNDQIQAGEFDTYNGMRVGVIEGNSRNDRFEEFAQENGFTYSLVYYEDTNQMQEDLQNSDRIDAIVTSNLRSIKNEWILNTFANSSFYAMVKKGNTELLDSINYAINQMNTFSIGWQDELFQKYYAGSSGDSIALSSTERAYLDTLQQTGKRIQVLVHPDREPYSYLENGTPKGMIPDLFEELATRLNLPFDYVICETREAYAEAKRNGSADVVLESRDNLSEAEDMGYKLTDSYMDLNYASLKRSDFNGTPKTAASINEAYTSDHNLAKLLQGMEIVYYDSLKECIQAVEKGDVDICYLYDYSAQKASAENKMGILQATSVSEVQDFLTLAVRATDDHRLLAILDKGINSVKEDYVDQVIRENTQFSIGQLSLVDTLRRNPILLAAIVGLIVLAVVLAANAHQRREANRIVQSKNVELERFIGYVCKANTSVMDVNFTTNKAEEYYLDHGEVRIRMRDFPYMNLNEIKKIIHPDDLEQVADFLSPADLKKRIDSGEDQYLECRMNFGEHWKWYSMTLTPVIRDADHPNNMMVFIRDIDESKKLEEQNRNSLEEALASANQASASKGMFLSNMSHEIRTPLNAIIGYLSLARDPDNTPDKTMHCIDNCEVASHHLLQIINDVLDMSSIESGKMKIAHEEFDLKKEISDITSIFFQNARSKGIEFNTHLEGLKNEWVVGDQLRLNQVLMNLLSNALKFTPENGKVALDIRQLREDEKQIYLQFKVSDTGVGMSEEYMNRIFKPFEQENAGTAKKFGGSGLGLSITSNLVHMMGGTIGVDSHQNQGTVFTVTMYFDKSMKEHVPLPAMDYSKVRVLVVDDQDIDSRQVKETLKRCGVKADCVKDGQTALKRVRSRMNSEYPYDMCLIDWNMPDMDGCEVAREIRKEFGNTIPVIIVTAYDISELEADAKASGVDKVVAKPLFQSTLFDLLVNTFGAYRPQNSETKQPEKISLEGTRILLAEDNPMNMEIAVSILKKTGVTVDQAKNGKEAVELFTSQPAGTYDLILMDVQMPIMDGYEATRAIRSSNHPEATTIPIVAMTANAFSEDVAEALSNGMNAHIAKPINNNKLFEVLKRYVSSKN